MQHSLSPQHANGKTSSINTIYITHTIKIKFFRVGKKLIKPIDIIIECNAQYLAHETYANHTINVWKCRKCNENAMLLVIIILSSK